MCSMYFPVARRLRRSSEEHIFRLPIVRSFIFPSQHHHQFIMTSNKLRIGYGKFSQTSFKSNSKLKLVTALSVLLIPKRFSTLSKNSSQVPEHFSSPLLILGKTEWGSKNLELIPQPSGTGQMLTSLDENQSNGQVIDVAVALTESLIAAKAKENGREDYKLVGSYVRSSLNWSV